MLRKKDYLSDAQAANLRIDARLAQILKPVEWTEPKRSMHAPPTIPDWYVPGCRPLDQHRYRPAANPNPYMSISTNDRSRLQSGGGMQPAATDVKPDKSPGRGAQGRLI